MASETPPATYSPKAKGDDEVLSQRTFLGRGEDQEAPEGEAPVAEHQGESHPLETGAGAVFSSALDRTRFRRPAWL